MAQDEYSTPDWVYKPLHEEFKFTLDAAASTLNTKCKYYYNKEENALEQNWVGRIWLNPPYSKAAGPIYKWVQKARYTAYRGSRVVMLLTADISTKWFHDLIWDSNNIEEHVYPNVELRFLNKRVRHLLNGKVTGSPPWGSMVVIFHP